MPCRDQTRPLQEEPGRERSAVGALSMFYVLIAPICLLEADLCFIRS